MSLQRRRERYIIIYMWKVLTAKVPNDMGISFYMDQRSSIKAIIPGIPSHRSNTSCCDKSFSVLGPKLWNILPSKCTLSLHSLDNFKQQFGMFIQQFPDLPLVMAIFHQTRIHSLTGLQLPLQVTSANHESTISFIRILQIY